MEPVRLTRESGVEPVIYFANSNIQPEEEYQRRLETLKFWAQDEKLEVVEGPYDSQAWENVVGRIGEAAREKFGVITHGAQPHGTSVSAGDSRSADGAGAGVGDGQLAADKPSADGGQPAASEPPSDSPAEWMPEPLSDSPAEWMPEPPNDSPAEWMPEPPNSSPAEQARQARCRACYRIRFEEAARYAAEHDFDALGTTLSVSPYQYTEIIREELERAAERASLKAHFVDYRPYYENATLRSRGAGMYRQNYCACRFSDEEAQVEREERKKARKAAKAARKAARAAELAAEQAAKEAERAAAKAAKLAAKETKCAAALAARRAAMTTASEVAQLAGSEQLESGQTESAQSKGKLTGSEQLRGTLTGSDSEA